MTLAATFLTFILGITLPATAHMYIRARKQPLNKKGFALLVAIFLPTYICTIEALRHLPEGENLAQFFIITFIAVSGIIATNN